MSKVQGKQFQVSKLRENLVRVSDDQTFIFLAFLYSKKRVSDPSKHIQSMYKMPKLFDTFLNKKASLF